MKTFAPLFFALLLLAACDNTRPSTEQSQAPATTTNDGHGHGDGAMSGPEMPPAPEGARVYFANLEDGQEVTSPVYIEFGAEGIEVEPAGEVKEGYGHHHILINEEMTPYGVAVPADETHIHYGGGQTSDTLSLPAGTHTLVLQFADGIHRSYGEALGAAVEITVVE